ncbi:MAG TPA: MBL fold metallo-hydrolase, partial [Planctomycetota bacterium]|nr:MBL fold metallo-hydrolase [Planctomycetota bacterium]
MKIRFLGAAGDVTGSAYYVTTKRAAVMVDCGMYQGGRDAREKNRRKANLEGGRLDAVVLTHCHLDHIGRLPLLVKAGYKGPIFGTRPTFEIAALILKDALYLQNADLERENTRRMRAGLEPLEPLYEEQHVKGLRPLTRPVKYDQSVEIAPGIRCRLVDAGHVIGSASVELTVEEGGRSKIVVFSGDLGPRGAPLLEDPVPFRQADVVIVESTYGDRTHRSLHETAIEARQIIAAAIKRRAKILVPVFAVGRTQLLLYLLSAAFKNKTLPRLPIYLDSPMAIEATKVYGRHAELFDAEAKAMIKSGDLRAGLQNVRVCATGRESRKLNDVPGPCLIMAGSGMCTGGRIVHHLRHNLYRPETAVMIVGFQSPGTLGRRLVDGAKGRCPHAGLRRASLHPEGHHV